MISQTRERQRALATLRGDCGLDIFDRVVVPGDVVVMFSHRRCRAMVVTSSTPRVIDCIQIQVTRAGHVRRVAMRASPGQILLVNENLSSQLPRIQEVIDEIRSRL